MFIVFPETIAVPFKIFLKATDNTKVVIMAVILVATVALAYLEAITIYFEIFLKVLAHFKAIMAHFKAATTAHKFATIALPTVIFETTVALVYLEVKPNSSGMVLKILSLSKIVTLVHREFILVTTVAVTPVFFEIITEIFLINANTEAVIMASLAVITVMINNCYLNLLILY